jgi:hypothetical protein
MPPDRERVQTEVLTAGWPNGLVADCHGPCVRDAVEGVAEGAGRVISDLTPACWGVVVEGCDCAERFDQAEIMGGAGCYRGVARAAIELG